MKFSYTPRRECQSFWTWFSHDWYYPNPNKPYPEQFHCWRFCGITRDIEKSDIGEEHWEKIRERKYPKVYDQLLVAVTGKEAAEVRRESQ